jgi:hypothetical protein
MRFGIPPLRCRRDSSPTKMDEGGAAKKRDVAIGRDGLMGWFESLKS